ncbi:MAG: phage major capsid protein [Defluviitaleaceae bacterium]|nr:phage major capsid protein [Defluviitaleaceae bacterium]MCL2263815.1 phage major capsid protein [Defluviitaleaceae bacterium]
MMTIAELREKRTKLWNQAQAFLDSRRVDGILSAADGEVFDKMESEIMELGTQIERLERHRDLGDQMNMPTSTPLHSKPGVHNRANHNNGEYTKAFWNALRGRGISNVLSVGEDTSGGYLVPEEFANELIIALEEQNIFRQIARIVRTSSDKLKVPVATAVGTASWIDENEVIPESESTFSQITLNAYKLGTMMRSSTELVEDSAFNIQSYIAQEFARRIGSREEEAFCLGDGAGKPTGIFGGTGGAQEGASATTTINFDNMIDLFYSLKPPYRNRAVFLVNDSTMKVLRKIKSGDGQYIWQPSVKEKTPDTILGRPVYVSPYAPEMAEDAYPVAFGDFNYYWIADRRDIRFRVLNELYAERDQIGFFATERIDGKLILPEAIKLLKMEGA